MNESILSIQEQYPTFTQYILVDKSVKYRFDKIKALFAAETIKGKKISTGQPAGGRGNATFMTYKDNDLIVKEYRRGGLISKISANRYLWLGLKRTRGFRELTLLLEMANKKLPVPQPFAVMVKESALTYTESIITYQLKQAKSLVEMSAKESHKRWNEVGQLIKRFHDENIYHADLNAHNILFNNEGLFLIDFDKCKQYKGVFNFWKARNIKRLLKSLQKLSKNQEIIFTNENWNALMNGYQQNA